MKKTQMNTDKHRCIFLMERRAAWQRFRCSGAAVLRLMLSEARVAFIKRCREERRAFKKNSLAMLGYRRSTAAPLQQTLALRPTWHRNYLCLSVFICGSFSPFHAGEARA